MPDNLNEYHTPVSLSDEQKTRSKKLNDKLLKKLDEIKTQTMDALKHRENKRAE